MKFNGGNQYLKDQVIIYGVAIPRPEEFRCVEKPASCAECIYKNYTNCPCKHCLHHQSRRYIKWNG